MSPCIHVERMMHRASIAVQGNSATSYTLVKLIPTGLGEDRPARLNLALALDVSGSMYEEDGSGCTRLARVQQAARKAIRKLRPDDTLAIIGFGHDARVLLPPTPVAEMARIESVIERIDGFDVDPGGTSMDEALALSLGEVEKLAGAGKLSRVVVLTDGETAGEQNCRRLAERAGAQKIPLAVMGVGLDWKASLLKELASLSQGKWYYIDSTDADDTARIFAEEFSALAATAFLDVRMHLAPMKDVHVQRIRQVAPEIKDLPLEEVAERSLAAGLGALRRDGASRYILELRLPARPDGKYVVAHLEVSWGPGAGQRESSGRIPLEVSYTSSGNGYVNAEVMRHIDEIRLKEMSDTLQQALRDNDQQSAQELAREMVKVGEMLGAPGRKKTQLAMKVLEELNAEGRVRRPTQLSLENEVRQGDVPS